MVELRKKIKEGDLTRDVQDERIILRLMEYFEPEIRMIDPKGMQDQVQVGGHLQGYFNHRSEENAEYKGIYRTRIVVPFRERLTVVNAINFDQFKVDDPFYSGKKWRGVVGFTEQAYANADFGWFRMKVGRDFLRWGAGINGTLLFSDMCRPMDQFSGSMQTGPFRFSFLTAVLDDLILSAALVDSLGGVKAQRYLTSHRLDAKFLDGRIQFAVTEALIYGGVGKSLDWIYSNPFLFFHGEQLNRNDQANTLGMLDLLVYPVSKWQLYGSLLIDDVQIEKTGSGDLEPDEIGWTVGTKLADPFKIEGMSLYSEFSRVTNRTYKTPVPWETMLHRNEPIGYPLGHDVDFWSLGISQWFNGVLKIDAGFSRIRKGEGSLFTSWDTPWMDKTVQEGYSEPYLTGIVEKRETLSLRLKYIPSIHWGATGEVQWSDIKNAGHTAGEKFKQTSWRIGVWVDSNLFLRF